MKGEQSCGNLGFIVPIDVCVAELDHCCENVDQVLQVQAVVATADVGVEDHFDVFGVEVIRGVIAEKQQAVGYDGFLFVERKIRKGLELQDHPAVLVQIGAGAEQVCARVEPLEEHLLSEAAHPDLLLGVLLRPVVARGVAGLHQEVLPHEQLNKQGGVSNQKPLLITKMESIELTAESGKKEVVVRPRVRARVPK